MMLAVVMPSSSFRVIAVAAAVLVAVTVAVDVVTVTYCCFDGGGSYLC